MSKNKQSFRFSYYLVSVNLLAFVYVAGYALFESNSSISRISILTALLMMVLLLARLIITGHLAIPRLIGIPIAFALFSSISILWATDLEIAWLYGSISLSAMLGAIAIWIALYNGLSYRTLFWSALTGSVVVVFYLIQNPEQVFDDIARSGGTFSNPNAAGIYLMCCTFLIISPPPGTSRVPKFNLAIAAGLLLSAVAFTGSRKTLIAVAVFVLYAAVVLFWQTRLRAYTAPALLLFIALVASVVLISPDISFASSPIGSLGAVQRLDLLLQGDEYSALMRESMISAGTDLWLKKPLIGHGYGQFGSLTPFGVYSHCNYVELLCNTGIIGAVLYYFFYILIGMHAVRLKNPQHLAALFIIGILALIDVAMVSVVSKPNWVLLVVAAYFAISNRPVKTLVLVKTMPGFSLKKTSLGNSMARRSLEKVLRTPAGMRKVLGK